MVLRRAVFHDRLYCHHWCMHLIHILISGTLALMMAMPLKRGAFVPAGRCVRARSRCRLAYLVFFTSLVAVSGDLRMVRYGPGFLDRQLASHAATFSARASLFYYQPRSHPTFKENLYDLFDLVIAGRIECLELPGKECIEAVPAIGNLVLSEKLLFVWILNTGFAIDNKSAINDIAKEAAVTY